MGSVHKVIYVPDIESIRMPLPLFEEQDRLVAEVWTAWHLIDRTVAQIELLLGRLAKHWQTLIATELDITRAA